MLALERVRSLSSLNACLGLIQCAITSHSNLLSQSLLVLIEGVLFNVKYLGSTHTDCEGRGEKEHRIHQAELAVHEVKVSFNTRSSIPKLS